MANMDRLFQMQKVLDDRIVKEHGLEGQNLLPKKILALQVELGELANELPEVFKFWSNKKNNYEKALKEYVDGLHFILSIGNELEINLDILNVEPYHNGSRLFWFKYVYQMIGDLAEDGCEFEWSHVTGSYLGLGEMLGFTWEQIEQAYLEKNKVNHERQDGGY